MSEKITYGRLFSFSVKNFKMKLARSVKKVIGNVKKSIKNFFTFLHEKLSKAEDRLLKVVDDAGDWAFEKLEERTVF
ncbi:hypothetical protein LCGC14_0770480 [marine sediment metagenome]|uniref:Uncharacterized protein n=1 Tax=marine sediment metagenome TaxID=412755 RepID=A0A0F9QI66_9ZZZZ